MHRIVAVAILGAVAPLAIAAQEDPPPRRNLKHLFSPIQKRAVVSAVANEIGLVVISIGKDAGVAEGSEFELHRRDECVARIIVDRADRKWSAGKVTLRKSDPKVGDDVCSESPLTPEQGKALLEYAFAFRPLKDEDQARIAAVLVELESDEIAVRERASKELVRMGGPASVVLRSLDLAPMGVEARARVEDVLKEFDRYNRLIQSPGLERDLEFLAVVDDPRGYERLKRILSGVRPFSSAGFPEKTAELAQYMAGWWAYSKDRVRWNPRNDRFEER
jgi:hypothetical protein